MWLPWKGVLNQIRIEREPKMKYMITEYQKTSAEILVSEVSMGGYMLSAPLEEPDSEEVLMLHTVSHGLTTESSGVEALMDPVKDNSEPGESNDDP